MYGTLLPNRVLVLSLYHPAIGCTNAATISPLKPSADSNVFLAPSGTNPITKTGNITDSIAMKKPDMPNPNAPNLRSDITPQV